MSILSKKVVFTVSLLVAICFSAYFRRSNRTVRTLPVSDLDSIETAIFAGGCFWCMESPFEQIDGVIAAESGYTGGHVVRPTYQQVCRTETGHVEAVRISYDKNRLTYDDLLEVFWRQINPTDGGGQFFDRGNSYLSAIFVHGDRQRTIAQASKARLESSKRFSVPIVTPIRDAAEFYLAEDYHQDYYLKHPLKYRIYRYRSGRDRFLDQAWGSDRDFVPTPPTEAAGFVKPTDEKLREKLTKLQYQVTQQDGTEPAFGNKYWDNKEAGIYVDIVSGEPLFHSRDKYQSGTGWPSFSRPIDTDRIIERTDYKLIWPRTEVRSRTADSHLGHVFSDGPAPTGLRYCLNSAALKFIPVDQLAEQGYAEYLADFADEQNKGAAFPMSEAADSSGHRPDSP